MPKSYGGDKSALAGSQKEIWVLREGINQQKQWFYKTKNTKTSESSDGEISLLTGEYLKQNTCINHQQYASTFFYKTTTWRKLLQTNLCCMMDNFFFHIQN